MAKKVGAVDDITVEKVVSYRATSKKHKVQANGSTEKEARERALEQIEKRQNGE